MTPELWQRLKPLYNSAMEMQEPKRAQFIAEACGADTELRKELEALLRAADQPTGAGDKAFFNAKDVFPLASNSFSEGEIILGRFRIVRHLGTGGMGEVYEANDLELGPIALKTIRPQIASSPRAYGRFRQEVVLARKVSGMQVCRIHELFLLPASGRRPETAFLTMEYLDGTTLSDKLANDGTFPLKETLKIALDICEGLQLIHQQGIVHRDLKPANIMLCERSGIVHAILMDFGLAFAATLDVSNPQEETRPAQAFRTLTGTVVGTPAYMAPEQFEGKPVTPAVDIYALGVILYQLLTGRHPYPAKMPIGVAMRRLKGPVLPSSIRHEVPHHWDRIIERCLEDEPSERFESAEQVAKALKASPLSLGNLRKDRPWVLQIAAVLAIALAAWGGFRWWQIRQYYHATPEEQRWYTTGLTALREGSYVKATRELGKATQENDRFVMAHTRLAEAYFDLDFEGTAQHEMLIATNGERRLPPVDQMYLDAIRAALTHDFNGAVKLYRRILDRLPDSQKSAGYVDLGMAYERAGNPSSAFVDYAKASKLDRDNPSPYMHMAVLESHQHNIQKADGAFDQAEAIFVRDMNQEGQAELDYERGYEINGSGDSAQANVFLERSLTEAKQIQSVQLEIRVLTQLSSSACGSGHLPQAVDYAQQAIHLARDNQLNTWAADGLARLANAEMYEGSEHFQEAEEAVDEGKTLAVQTQQPRAEALANLVLAILRDKENRPKDAIAPAQAALQYFKQNGFFEPAAKASLVLVRSQANIGHLDEAQKGSASLLNLAMQSGDRDLIPQAEEAVGIVFFYLERYPESLNHYQSAWQSADTDTGRSYEAVNYANLLQKLGRYSESDSMLNSVTTGDTTAVVCDGIRVESLLSQQKYAESLRLARKVIAAHPSMTADYKQIFEMDQTVAEAHLGQRAVALDHLNRVLRKRRRMLTRAKQQRFSLRRRR